MPPIFKALKAEKNINGRKILARKISDIGIPKPDNDKQLIPPADARLKMQAIYRS
ncbi:hypothetical protein KO537_21115 [Shewanella sp. NKUCC01_JLK]|uniref:hypothetical protein n=1 Tax=Shewanella sp. NKUCC01_JLK TaxID=2842123 RepID=UPI001C5B9732|nr:hypothetical protein [Shewanella sp. NKUCC01_JLK]MBW3517192.1 hypothetical protein [Shewanella sp. NKUCC01_JLK]